MRSNLLFGIAVLCCVTVSLSAEPKPPFSYAYVVVAYQCERGPNLAIFSQVFGVCEQETNHSTVALGQRLTCDQVAKASCMGAASAPSQRTSFSYPGPDGRRKSQSEWVKDSQEGITYRFKFESVFLATPYSSKCDNCVLQAHEIHQATS